MPAHFANYGYNPVCAGKMHFLGYDQMHGWRERIGRDIAVNMRLPSNRRGAPAGRTARTYPARESGRR